MKQIIYYRSAKTASSSIVRGICDSPYETILIDVHTDLNNIDLNKYQIIIVNVACYPLTDTFLNIQKNINKLKNCKSFAVVRNPYSKFVSSINYCNLTNEQLLKLYDNNLELTRHDQIHITRTQTDALSINNEFFADKIINFESLHDVAEFFRSHGYDINIPVCNVTENKNLKLDRTMIQYVNKTFAADFKHFGYKFEE
tara:strand:- start:8192 stop:8788 length:597 start_codon:yes stop_codon:yes gene_type:complete